MSLFTCFLKKRQITSRLDQLHFGNNVVSGVTGRGTGGGQRGQSAPQRLLTRKFLPTYQEKRGKEKREKGWKLRRKIVKTKVENWKWKYIGNVVKRSEDFFFFFFLCFSLLKTMEICFGCTKMEFSTGKKTFYARKKVRKNDFAPSEKYVCYAPEGVLQWVKSQCQDQTQHYHFFSRERERGITVKWNECSIW